MYKHSHKALSAALLTVVAVLMWCFNHFTPLFLDDWHYAFIFGTQEPVRSISDIIVSQYHHYFGFNGRAIVHFFVQVFDGLLGKGVFNVVNALIFVLFLYTLAMNTSHDKSSYYKIMSVAFILIFLLMTGFKYTILWLSGAVNYLWVGVAVLCFLYLMEKEEVASWARVPLFLFGFICGWSNEALAVGLGAAYFFYYAFHRKRLCGHRLWMLSGFYLGALFLVFSPAAINRALSTSARQLSILERVINLQNLSIFFILLAFVVIKVIFKKISFREWVKREQVLILATLMSILFIIFTGFYYSHSRFGIELFSLLLLLRAIDWNKVNTILVSLANVCVLAFAIYAVSTSARCYEVAQSELSQVAAGDSVIITSEPVKSSSYLRRFVLDYAGLGIKNGIDEVKYYGEDDWIPKYYGYKDKMIYFWPDIFIKDLQLHYKSYDDFSTLEELPFYTKRITDGEMPALAELVYYPSKFSSLPWPLSRICDKCTGFSDSEVTTVRVLPVDGEQYVIVSKTRASLSQHLKEIKLLE
jgi:hypothetical protein